MYMVSVVSLTLVMAFTGLDIMTAFTAVVASINNTGPGLGVVGPSTTYAVLDRFPDLGVHFRHAARPSGNLHAARGVHSPVLATPAFLAQVTCPGGKADNPAFADFLAESDVSRPKNDTFLRALLKEPTEYTPLWLMRQAGRYLPEYCETRKRAGNFLNLCKSPAMACEVTLQPLARYDLDAAILFSDILTVPDAMGLGLYFAEGEGPKFERPLREEWAIRNLTAPDPNDQLGYVMDAVSEIRRALDNSVPLIGFSGSPWTLACYMVEGGALSDFRKVKAMLYNRPDLLHRILSVTADSVIAYLNAQIDCGAQAVMIFDTWGGSLPGRPIRSSRWPTCSDRRRPEEGKGRRAHPEHRLHQERWPVAGKDRRHRLRRGRPRLDHRHRRSPPPGGRQGGLQGNLDPNVLFGSRKSLPPKRRRSSTASARAIPAMSSTWAMAFRNSPRRKA
jgi:uroporphyrinogen-III decarboxylase